MPCIFFLLGFCPLQEMCQYKHMRYFYRTLKNLKDNFFRLNCPPIPMQQWKKWCETKVGTSLHKWSFTSSLYSFRNVWNNMLRVGSRWKNRWRAWYPLFESLTTTQRVLKAINVFSGSTRKSHYIFAGNQRLPLKSNFPPFGKASALTEPNSQACPSTLNFYKADDLYQEQHESVLK